ncbi:MAG: hypothetical protein B7X41_12085 [Microbacterium sp. 14-71-5]|nr:MAG: hypothetical protein B7X41_12085 [Microbacterium sp. 14-71-5]
MGQPAGRNGTRGPTTTTTRVCADATERLGDRRRLCARWAEQNRGHWLDVSGALLPREQVRSVGPYGSRGSVLTCTTVA